jgi:hypothetical protein
VTDADLHDLMRRLDDGPIRLMLPMTSIPTMIISECAARQYDLNDGDTVHVPDGGLVGGAGRPPTPTTRPMKVVIDRYIPLGAPGSRR